MMFSLMISFSILSFLFSTSTSPLLSVVIIIVTSLLACFLMAYASYSSWFSLIFFLIFLGGLMVLFTYTCSLASNEMHTFKTKNQVILSLVVASLGASLIEQPYYKGNFFFISLQSMLGNCNVLVILLAIIYLLLTLVVAVLISSYKYGPIRTKKN